MKSTLIKKLWPFFLLFSASGFSSTLNLDHLIGQYDQTRDPNFVALDSTILPVNKKGMFLQKEVTEKLIAAYLDFKNTHPDIPFIVVSATRNYQYQNGIWSNKWNKKKSTISNPQQIAKDILRYSSMPGTSRHHWGTDFDITSVEPDYFDQNPQGQILYQWMNENMAKYGFCQPYKAGRKGGYSDEKWHWSYAPISKQYLTDYKTIMNNNPEKITRNLTFVGHDKIKLIPLLIEYVFDVDVSCQ